MNGSLLPFYLTNIRRVLHCVLYGDCPPMRTALTPPRSHHVTQLNYEERAKRLDHKSQTEAGKVHPPGGAVVPACMPPCIFP